MMEKVKCLGYQRQWFWGLTGSADTGGLPVPFDDRSGDGYGAGEVLLQPLLQLGLESS